jgi:hypothetical protein
MVLLIRIGAIALLDVYSQSILELAESYIVLVEFVGISSFFPKKSVRFDSYTNSKKLLYKSPHTGLLPLDKLTMRTYWDWYYKLL